MDKQKGRGEEPLPRKGEGRAWEDARWRERELEEGVKRNEKNGQRSISDVEWKTEQTEEVYTQREWRASMYTKTGDGAVVQPVPRDPFAVGFPEDLWQLKEH